MLNYMRTQYRATKGKPSPLKYSETRGRGGRGRLQFSGDQLGSCKPKTPAFIRVDDSRESMASLSSAVYTVKISHGRTVIPDRA
jgi:hypothetical protein